MNRTEMVGYGVMVALVFAGALALVAGILIAATLMGAFVVYEDDAGSRRGHELVATEVQELRRDVWVIQTAIAPRP